MNPASSSLSTRRDAAILIRGVDGAIGPTPLDISVAPLAALMLIPKRD